MVGREHGDDAVDGLGGVQGVQGREDHVAGFGGEQRRFDGLAVAHFADQDHVRVLTQGAAQRVGEALGVDVDLALGDDALLVAVEELDGVLDGDDVVGLVLVDVVDHRGQRRRLAATGGPGDQNQAAGDQGDLLEHLGQIQLVECLDVGGDDAEDQRDRAPLLEDVHAEPAQGLDAVGQIELGVFLEIQLLAVVHDAEGHEERVFLRQLLEVDERHQFAIDANVRERARLEMKVRRPLRHGDLQKVIYFHGVAPIYRLVSS